MAAFAGLMFFSSCKKNDDTLTINFTAPPSTTIVKSGTVKVITENNVRFHVLEFGKTVTSTIVETENAITIVDVGFGLIANSGQELRAYADSIKKPMNIIITHDHRDHFMNLDHFNDIAVYAEAKSASLLLADTNFTNVYKGNVIAVNGSQSIGGLDYMFGDISNTEAPENGYISIPSLQSFFPGDLTFNKAHTFIRDYTPLDGTDELTGWINSLQYLKNQFGSYKHIFVGHNGYSDNVSDLIDANIAYLKDAQGLIKGTKKLTNGAYASTVKQVVDELALLYPDYGPGGLYLALPDAFYPGDPGALWF